MAQLFLPRRDSSFFISVACDGLVVAGNFAGVKADSDSWLS